MNQRNIKKYFNKLKNTKNVFLCYSRFHESNLVIIFIPTDKTFHTFYVDNNM